MTGFDSVFEEQGYLPAPLLLSMDEIDRLAVHVDTHSDISPSDRRLLDYSWCRMLVPVIIERLVSENLVPSGYAAILCTFFNKSDKTN